MDGIGARYVRLRLAFRQALEGFPAGDLLGCFSRRTDDHVFRYVFATMDPLE